LEFIVARPTLITVKGQLFRVDGTPDTGSLTFQSRVLALYSLESQGVVPSRKTVLLDEDGKFEIELPATNDPAWTPVGWTYTLVMHLSEDYSIYDVSIPHDAPGAELSLAELIPATPSTGIVPGNYAPLVHKHAASDIISGTIDMARLPVGLTHETVAYGDHTHAGGGTGGPIAIADVTGLVAALNAKANTSHTHAIDDVTGLQTALNGKAALVHTHAIADTSGLQGALDLKANSSDVTSSLATKANSSDVATSLSSKANTTDVNIALATKADSSAVSTALALKANTSSLATVATTGSYNDLTDKPSSGGGSPAVSTVAGRTGDVVLTKSDVGLTNVDNTADTAKPVSTAQQTALNLKANSADLATVATTGSYTDLADKPTIPTVPVTSVAGKTGAVTLVKGDVGLANVDNTADAAKPISTATQTALDAKAASSHTHAVLDVTGLSAILDEKADVVDLATVATTGSYNDLADKPTIPTVPVTSVAGRTGAITLTKSDVSLSNVDNTADTAKPVSTAQQAALDLKAPLASPTFTGTVAGITKTMVGLANVDNTADAAKPISTATQTALDLKAPLASPTFTGTVSGITKAMVGLSNVDNTADTAKPVSTATQTALNAKQNSSADLTSISGLTPTNDDVLQRKAGSWTNRTIAQLKTDLAVTKSDVGLANVDNTSDASKPVSTAQQTALDLKAPLASPTFTGTVSGITKAMVGLTNVDNTADTAKPVSTAQQTALNLKANLASPTFTGTVAGITSTMVGLGNVDNTSDATKNAAAVTLTNKTIASPAFTGTPTGLTKSHVGLANVDNTADTAKPVSTAQQTAIDAKAPAILVWSGSAYVATNTAVIYVGATDPATVTTVPNGSIWIAG
jgi:predicted flap endonuclease-1-like 5' DNA nuclease